MAQKIVIDDVLPHHPTNLLLVTIMMCSESMSWDVSDDVKLVGLSRNLLLDLLQVIITLDHPRGRKRCAA